MASITQQIEELIRSQAAAAPGLVSGYESSLATAAGQDQQSIDSLGALYRDKSKFEKPVMGALGLGLMKPTKSGNFSEGMYNGLAAATAAQDLNREMNLTREEKLAKLNSLQATLTRQQGADTLDVYGRRNDVTNSLGTMNTQLSDIELGKTPGDPAETPMQNSMRVYNDYLTNPARYQGPHGQAMVKNAIDILKNERTNARYESIASQKAAAKPTISAPEQRRVSTRMKDLDEAAEAARGLKGSVSALRLARSKTDSEGGFAADTRATVGGFFGLENASNMQTVRSLGVDMKLNLSQKLKGAISNAEQGMLENATPGLGMTDDAANPVLDAYDMAADRVTERAKFMKAWTRTNGDDYGADEAWDNYVNDNPIVMQDEKGGLALNKDNVGNWQKYVIDVSTEDGAAPAAGDTPDFGFDPASLPPEVRTWAQEQLDGGADPSQVLEYLRTEYGEQ